MLFHTHTERPSREDLLDLIAVDASPVVSLFHPTVRAVYQRQQNSDRLKTLYYAARRELVATGMHRIEVEELLDPVRRLVTASGSWAHPRDGLAVFAWPGGSATYRLPFTVETYLSVGGKAAIKPLLPALSLPPEHYVLALSRNRVRLLKASVEGCTEVDAKELDIPRSLQESLRYDDFSRNVQSHATGRADPAAQTHSQATARAGRHVWHGHGAGDEILKDQLTRFFLLLDTGIRRLLDPIGAPLMVVGVAYERALYRKLAHYRGLLSEGVDGNPDLMSPRQIHDCVWPLAEDRTRLHVDEAKAAFARAGARGYTATAVTDVISAAASGRVASLFLLRGRDRWAGPDLGTPEEHARRQPGDVDLLDVAARETLVHGGDAYALAAGEMPCAGDAAATLRY